MCIQCICTVLPSSHTHRPRSPIFVSLRSSAGWTELPELCVCRGVGVPARKGRMLVFHNVQHDGTPDNRTSHVSCPVRDGEKVVVSRFIRQDTCYLNKDFSKRKWNGNVYCADDHTRCAEWAAQGYCTAGGVSAGGVDMHEIMVGDSTWPGFCERTCDTCRCDTTQSRLIRSQCCHV